MQDVAGPGLRVVQIADTGPVLPGAKQHFLGEILRLLEAATKQVGLPDQAGPRLSEEVLVLLVPCRAAQLGLLLAYLTIRNTHEQANSQQPVFDSYEFALRLRAE
jgi:hypothetical protein